MKYFIFLSLLIISPAAICDDKSNSASDSVVFALKSGIKSGCLKRGEQKGDDSQYVKELCDCIMTTLDKNISESEWKKIAYSVTVDKKSMGEIPEMDRAISETKACKK